jgi:hypothetical protein
MSVDKSDWKEVNLHDYIERFNIPAPEVDPVSLAEAMKNVIWVNSIEEAVDVIMHPAN